MAITNWYEKYGIAPNASLAQIQYILQGKIRDEQHSSFSAGHSERLAQLNEAQAAFASEESRAKYDQMLNQSSKSAFELWLPRAQAFCDIKNFHQAAVALEKAFSEGVPPWDVYHNAHALAAKVYAGLGKYDEALKYIEQAITGAGNNQQYQAIKSEIINARDKDKYAPTMFDKLLAQAKDYYDKQQYPLALTALQTALNNGKPDINDTEAHKLIALVYAANNMFNEALHHIGQAIVMASTNGQKDKELSYVFTKADIYQKLYGTSHYNSSAVTDMRDALEYAVILSGEVGDFASQATAYDRLANTWHNFNGFADKVKAEDYAAKALAIDPAKANSRQILKELHAALLADIGETKSQIKQRAKRLRRLRFAQFYRVSTTLYIIVGIFLIAAAVGLGFLPVLLIPGIVLGILGLIGRDHGKKLFRNDRKEDISPAKTNLKDAKDQLSLLTSDKDTFETKYFPL